MVHSRRDDRLEHRRGPLRGMLQVGHDASPRSAAAGHGGADHPEAHGAEQTVTRLFRTPCQIASPGGLGQISCGGQPLLAGFRWKLSRNRCCMVICGRMSRRGGCRECKIPEKVGSKLCLVVMAVSTD